MNEEVDVLVIGAGPSGTVAASYLADKGLNVMIVEKQRFPRYVIGESLLPLSMEHFEETGLLPALEAQHFEMKQGALFIKDGNGFRISFDENYTPGWTWAWQVPRREFDKVLADETERKGARIVYQSMLKKICFDDPEKVSYTIDSPEGKLECTARYVIDSSGFGGVLCQQLDIPLRISPTSNMAVYGKVKDVNRGRSDNPMQITFEVLERDLWFWVIPFHNGNTSLGFVGDSKYFDAFEDDCIVRDVFKQMMQRSERFYERFADAEFLWDPKVHKSYSRQAERFYGDRFVLTGNTTEFLDPVFSSGVAFATESGLLAAKLIARQLSGEKVDWEQEYVAHLEQGISVFRSYVEQWYNGNLQKIFFHSNINQQMKRQLTSVLAGYVWDQSNPFVRKHKTILSTLAEVVDIENMNSIPH